eukprot:SAG25_NODE_2255_length_1786_cov_1.634855_2_plen_185_part_00
MTNGVDGAIDELQSVRELLQTIVDKNPNFVRARVGVTRCDERLGILRTARLHGQKQSIMNAVHGTNYLNASLCDAGIDESMVTARVRPPNAADDASLCGDHAKARALFDSIDANGNGLLDREELVALSSQLGGLAIDDDAMAELCRDGSGEVAFDSFWAWWQQMSTSDKQRGFLERLSKGLGLV